MTQSPPRYACPQCGFAIFNRRVKACESCRAALPESLLFNPADLDRLAQDAAAVAELRAELARDADSEAKARRHLGAGLIGPLDF